MKITDLRIANIVEHYIEDSQTWEMSIVNAQDLVFFEQHPECFLEHHRPVLLSSERLSKMMYDDFVSFGDEKYKCFLDSTRNKFISVLFDPFEEDRFNVFLEYSNNQVIMLNPIKYLHELQNVVFVLAGKEIEVVYE